MAQTDSLASQRTSVLSWGMQRGSSYDLAHAVTRECARSGVPWGLPAGEVTGCAPELGPTPHTSPRSKAPKSPQKNVLEIPREEGGVPILFLTPKNK